MNEKELVRYCTTEYEDGLCDICNYKEECDKFIRKYGVSPLGFDDNTQYKIGDNVVVTELPSKDIYGNDYNESGGGGTIVDFNKGDAIIRLFDGYMIRVENGNFDRCNKTSIGHIISNNMQLQEFVERCLSQIFDLCRYGDLMADDICEDMGITEDEMYWMFEQLGYKK